MRMDDVMDQAGEKVCSEEGVRFERLHIGRRSCSPNLSAGSSADGPADELLCTTACVRTQNHRVAWVGRDLKDHSSPLPGCHPLDQVATIQPGP